ncbi:PREDICTED: thylakoid lumenal 15 kDa protein 1, chloroplastic-like isoform X1 [Populus euphratica]|uniref:Thylakoid lumenal 15 kDa protein 1, chloroplastic-like isoform X1 n=1 Tax=Populus euphratica TaxID=75702 RepID=A0AAJ6X1U6_POPEU|nr:PREDICTED: thylakoid lumenal 15 kDa protein 1, chloroplastic-like isoform X1 [Populus euphratica]
MAHLLNVSLCTKIPPKPPLSLTKPSLSIPRFLSLSRSRCPNPQQALILNKQLLEDFAKTGLLALLSVSLSFTDPALAFKGGGPYGSEVTRGQDLTGKDFSGRTLIKQDFKTSILRQANFKGAKLLGASFFDSDLTGADLSDADLRSADLSLANVAKVNLSNANLEGALATGNTSFRGSNITGADFTDVPLREDQREYLCKVADGVNPTTGNATRDTLLCN